MKIVTWIAFWILLIFATVVISFELQGILLGSQLLQQHPYMQYLCRMLLLQDVCSLSTNQSNKSQLQSLLARSHTQQQYDRLSSYADISQIDTTEVLLSLHHFLTGTITQEMHPEMSLVIVYHDLYGSDQRTTAALDFVNLTRSVAIGKHNRMMRSGRNRYSIQLFDQGIQIASYDLSLYAPVESIKLGDSTLYIHRDNTSAPIADNVLGENILLHEGCIDPNYPKLIIDTSLGTQVVPSCLIYNIEQGYLFLLQSYPLITTHDRINIDILDVYGTVLVKNIPLFLSYEGLWYQSIITYDPLYQRFEVFYYDRIQDKQWMKHQLYGVDGVLVADMQINASRSILEIRNQYQSYQLGIDEVLGRYGRLEEQVVKRFTKPVTTVLSGSIHTGQPTSPGLQYWIDNDMIYITNDQQQGRIWIDDMRQQWRGVKE